MCVMSYAVLISEEEETNREFRQFAYKACTGPYSFLNAC